MNFGDIPRITLANYRADLPLKYVESWVQERGDIIDLSPDYQRGHVWLPEQEVAYVEWLLRGGQSGRDIYWNCPGWMNSFKGPLELVDGKQRIKAVRGFIGEEFRVFGQYFSEFKDPACLNTICLTFHIADLTNRKQVLQWYVDMNSGGTIHTPEELHKVRELIQRA